MRFMVILKTTHEVENANAAKGPTEELLNAMGKLNSDMVKPGVLLSGEGLAPTEAGETIEVEVRRIMEADDFGDEFTPEARAAEENLRQQIAEQHG